MIIRNVSYSLGQIPRNIPRIELLHTRVCMSSTFLDNETHFFQKLLSIFIFPAKYESFGFTSFLPTLGAFIFFFNLVSVSY